MKVIRLVAILGFIFVICTGCAPAEALREFPLSEEVIGQAIAEEGLPWALAEPQSFKEGHKLFNLQAADKKMVGVISSYGIDDRKALTLQFTYPMEGKSLMVGLGKESWGAAVKLACNLYGMPTDYSKMYKQMNDYIKGRSCGEFGDAVLDKKLCDTHYIFSFRQGRLNPAEYDFSVIYAMNHSAYNGYMQDMARVWRYSREREKITLIDCMSVRELEAVSAGKATADSAFTVNGQLENIKPIKKASLLGLTSFYDEKPLYYKDYLSATLTDGTASIPVLVSANSYSTEELSGELKHCITYYSAQNTFVVDNSSVIIEMLF